MSVPIEWTKEADETFEIIVELLDSVWGTKETTKFIKRVNQLLFTIREQPFIFKFSEINLDIKKALISKQTSFFYKIEKDRIIILYFWDNRQEPIL
jgi:plasmid stabilization system protein ParE